MKPWLVSSLVFLVALTTNSLAENFPNKAIKLMMPFPVGGSADVGARKFAPLLSQQLGVPVIVDNRPGAASNIGTALLAKSEPDGHTLGYILTSTMVVNPHIYSNPGFDPLRDFVPITLTVKFQGILLVRAGSPFRSVEDLIRAAKAQPGKLSYASGGAGSPAHLMMERLKQLTGTDLLHVPYKGEAQYYPELLAGQVDVAFGFSASALPQLRSGKLRALGVSAAQRLPSLPEIPTLAEAGVTGYDESMWAGYAAPAGTPPERVRKLQQAFHTVLRSPEWVKFVDELGYEVTPTTSEEAMARLKADYERYGQIVKTLGLRID